MNRNELEDRLVDFAVCIIRISELLPKSGAGVTLAKQISRSGTSPALNYGEAQSAESKKDFVYKLKIVVKELRETFVCLKIILRADLFHDVEKLNIASKECDELISIFVKSIKTAQENLLYEKTS